MNGLIEKKSPVEFDIALARALAAEAALAYSASQIVSDETGAAARINYNADKGAIIVSFRGSCAPIDFIQDGKFELRMLGYSNASNPVRVHAGFLEDISAIDSGVTQQVRGLLDRFPQAQLWVTGHSLGGALALLYAVEAVRLGLPVAWVYTFGQPRVGDAAWAAMYEGLLGERTMRVVNENDIVPRTPP